MERKGKVLARSGHWGRRPESRGSGGGGDLRDRGLVPLGRPSGRLRGLVGRLEAGGGALGVGQRPMGCETGGGAPAQPLAAVGTRPPSQQGLLGVPWSPPCTTGRRLPGSGLQTGIRTWEWEGSPSTGSGGGRALRGSALKGPLMAANPRLPGGWPGCWPNKGLSQEGGRRPTPWPPARTRPPGAGARPSLCSEVEGPAGRLGGDGEGGRSEPPMAAVPRPGGAPDPSGVTPAPCLVRV